MTNERDKVKKKIIALLNKTEDAGASENEAMIAAQKAAELMAHYDIESSELDIRNQNCKTLEVDIKLYNRVAILKHNLVGIARLCDCKVWLDGSTKSTAYFFGMSQDLEIAEYLCKVIETAMERELRHYTTTADFALDKCRYGARQLKISFLCGMAQRINENLKALIDEKKKQVFEAKGTDLVVMKNEQVQKEYDDLGMRLVTSRSRRTVRAYNAMESGKTAADRVGLSSALKGRNEATGVIA